MIFFFHLALSAGLVWMVLDLWQRLPLDPDETDDGRLREFIRWTVGGVGVPIGVWIFMNLGLSRWLPPFLSQVDVAKNAGGFWLWAALRYSSPGMTLITSCWAGCSLIALTWMVRSRTDNRQQFNQTVLLWSLVLCPVVALMILVGGVRALGLAVVLWLAPIIHTVLRRTEVPKRAPSYAAATGKLKFGKYSEAEMEIIKELETCENDFNGWMMLAELYAVHFHDFKQAEQTVIDLCDQPDIEPSNACVALHRLADWYLNLEQDPQGARRCMEAISTRYHGTHLDRMARLRLRSMPRDVEELVEERKAKPVHLPALHEGLEDPNRGEEMDMDAIGAHATSLSKKLSADPDNTGTREEFARALAKLGRLQPAMEQMDLLLSMDRQPAKRRAEWMGLKATWMMQLTGDGPDLRGLLQKIIRDFPGSPQAMGAQRRIFLLEERARVAKYSRTKKKPRIVVRMQGSGETPSNGSQIDRK